MRERAVILLGRRSFIGQTLEQHFRRQGVERILSVSSAECDLADAEAVRRLFASVGDAECAVLFLSAVNKWQDNSYVGFVKNVAMVHNVKEALPASTSVLVYFSSADVYGVKPALPITERTALQPDSWYGMAKQVAEWMLSTAAHLPCPVTILRLPGVYGAGTNDRSIVGRFAVALRQQKTVMLTGDGSVRRDYVYVEDIGRLVQSLIERKYHGVLNVATGDSLPLRDIVSALAAAIGASARVGHGDADVARDFDMDFDTSLLRTVVPDFSFTPLAVAARCYAAN